MNLFDKDIGSFEVKNLDNSMKYDDNVFQSFLFLLNRLAKGNSQNVKLIEQVQTSVLSIIKCRIKSFQLYS